jgi:hypothetical protein
MQRPLLQRPPDAILPDPAVQPDWYGEVWIRYPMSQSRLPSLFGHEFRAKAQFRIIMNDFSLAAYSGVKKPAITLAKAYGLYTQLRRWWDGLPDVLTARNVVLPGHLQLQHVVFYSCFPP